MKKFIGKYIRDMISVGANVVIPSSSGKDGYLINFNGKDIFIDSYTFERSYKVANDYYILGFIKGDKLFAMNDTFDIKYKVFLQTLTSLLKDKV